MGRIRSGHATQRSEQIARPRWTVSSRYSTDEGHSCRLPSFLRYPLRVECLHIEIACVASAAVPPEPNSPAAASTNCPFQAVIVVRVHIIRHYGHPPFDLAHPWRHIDAPGGNRPYYSTALSGGRRGFLTDARGACPHLDPPGLPRCASTRRLERLTPIDRFFLIGSVA
jgi:hypothetical protein